MKFGRSILGKFAFFSDPRSKFRRILGVIIVITGLLIVTGGIKKVESYIIENNIFINTLSLDTTLNDIVLKNHNNQGGQCADGSCDNQKTGDLMIDVAMAPEFE